MDDDDTTLRLSRFLEDIYEVEEFLDLVINLGLWGCGIAGMEIANYHHVLLSKLEENEDTGKGPISSYIDETLLALKDMLHLIQSKFNKEMLYDAYGYPTIKGFLEDYIRDLEKIREADDKSIKEVRDYLMDKYGEEDTNVFMI